MNKNPTHEPQWGPSLSQHTGWRLVSRKVAENDSGSEGGLNHYSKPSIIRINEAKIALCLARGRVCRLPESQAAVISLLSVGTICMLHVIKCMYIQHVQGLCQLGLSTADTALSLGYTLWAECRVFVSWSSFLTGNTLRLHNNDQPVNAV
jgi:hypothetical protein